MTKEVQILVKARDEASAKFGSIGTALGGLKSQIAGLAGAAAATLSVGAMVAFLKSSVEAAMDAEANMQRLAASIELAGGNAQEQLPKLDAFAQGIAAVTTYNSGAVKSAMALGASLTGTTGPALEQITVAAMGLASKLGKDLPTTMQLLAKAQNGNTVELSRYGIAMREGMTDQEKFNALLEMGQRSFAMTTSAAMTQSGQMKQLGNDWGDFKERIGQAIMESELFRDSIDIAGIAVRNMGDIWGIVWRKALEWIAGAGLAVAQLGSLFIAVLTETVPSAIGHAWDVAQNFWQDFADSASTAVANVVLAVQHLWDVVLARMKWASESIAYYYRELKAKLGMGEGGGAAPEYQAPQAPGTATNENKPYIKPREIVNPWGVAAGPVEQFWQKMLNASKEGQANLWADVDAREKERQNKANDALKKAQAKGEISVNVPDKAKEQKQQAASAVVERFLSGRSEDMARQTAEATAQTATNTAALVTAVQNLAAALTGGGLTGGAGGALVAMEIPA